MERSRDRRGYLARVRYGIYWGSSPILHHAISDFKDTHEGKCTYDVSTWVSEWTLLVFEVVICSSFEVRGVGEGGLCWDVGWVEETKTRLILYKS